MTQNLWGDLSSVKTTISETPKAILDEQASYFNKEFGPRILAKVSQSKNVGSMSFQFDFELIVPTLNNYTLELFTIKHKIPFYPLTIGSFYYFDDEHGATGIVVNDQLELVSELESLLSSGEVHDIIVKLLSMVNG